MRDESFEFLRRLLTSPSPSGYEAPGQRVWCEYVRTFADDVCTDSYGNAVAVLNPGGDPKVMLDGHIDELGLMVKHIDDLGFIYFQRIGGVDPALVRGKRVDIHTRKGIVRGVTGSTAIHLQDREKEAKVPKMHEIFIDIGAKDGKAAAKQVAVGDPITFVDSFEMLNKHVAVARAMDDRIGTWVVAEAMRLAKEAAGGKKLACALYITSSVQEEVGLNGAAMNIVNVAPHLAICAEVTHATDTPGIDVKQHGKTQMGAGPTVSLGRENHPALVQRLRDVAAGKKIPLQIETFSLSGGTDAMAFFNKLGGIPSAVLGVPNRYMHSTVEMIDLRDLEHAAELLAAFVTGLKKGERFKVNV
ncbi:MAG: M42 family metallopeptidase [Planctomycetota bacterium]